MNGKILPGAQRLVEGMYDGLEGDADFVQKPEHPHGARSRRVMKTDHFNASVSRSRGTRPSRCASPSPWRASATGREEWNAPQALDVTRQAHAKSSTIRKRSHTRIISGSSRRSVRNTTDDPPASPPASRFRLRPARTRHRRRKPPLRHLQRLDHKSRIAIPVERDVPAAHLRHGLPALPEVPQCAAGRCFRPGAHEAQELVTHRAGIAKRECLRARVPPLRVCDRLDHADLPSGPASSPLTIPSSSASQRSR